MLSNKRRRRRRIFYFTSSFPSPSLPFFHPKWEIDKVDEPARFLHDRFLPIYLLSSTNQRACSIKKERKKCRFTNCETRFPLACCGWLRSRLINGGTHDKKYALDWRKSRWFLDPALSVKPHPSLRIKAQYSRWVSLSLSRLEQDDEFASLFPLDCYKTVRASAWLSDSSAISRGMIFRENLVKPLPRSLSSPSSRNTVLLHFFFPPLW